MESKLSEVQLGQVSNIQPKTTIDFHVLNQKTGRHG